MLPDNVEPKELSRIQYEAVPLTLENNSPEIALISSSIVGLSVNVILASLGREDAMLVHQQVLIPAPYMGFNRTN